MINKNSLPGHKLSSLIKSLTENEFYNFVFNTYKPSAYESDELTDKRFHKGTYYSHVCRTRCFLVYNQIIQQLSEGSRILDIGLYPGTILRQLSMLLGDKVSLYGVGQKVDEKFESYMAPYIKECVNTELDPFYNKSNEKIHIPYDDGKFNAVIATEILEHLISPLELIAEASRILAPGGIFIMTTPNISHIGAVCKLLLGRSNHERLDRSPMYLQNNLWRGHIRFYDKKELNTLFERNGLTMIHHKYYIDKGWSHAKWPMLKRLIISLMDKIAPIYRDGHFAVFKKQ